jgi:hypothetical protein
MVVISLIEIKGVFLAPFIINNKKFEHWQVAGYSILLVLSFFF